MHSFSFAPIGIIESPFRERFGIPRQPGLAPTAQGRLRLLPPYDNPACVEGLEQVSHLWVQFVFHATAAAGWQPRVRPPRLGGNRRLGVFASRSNFRPNPIGLSVVRLDRLDYSGQRASLLISGLDLLDGTPVLDIKPYVPYVDAVDDARNGIAAQAPAKALRIGFSPEALAQLARLEAGAQLQRLIGEILSLDPRPAYRQGESGREHATRLMGQDVRWRMLTPDQAEVFEIRPDGPA
ncbi:tRNA (N6-threonylcarbamoyladenosine(37)-N6)-methyltransferase TrmO [Magnetovirga frankeli]|uniref:tRNA (N6-threonylcarbamoyladenosine(37)-N6)-methyltransferase TrmO n=1 Tax=Magnetovirga frankeli TaxID=947516 RepID=UPI001292F954|nr:tRNA (N6-threonylcarbamoyladenosine(37)-N6)-methyltransferase TrmO [gamma proteobacterium SS-5]